MSGKKGQLGVLANCGFCGSYFMQVVDEYPMASFRGKKGKAALASHISEIHAKQAAGLKEVPCPTCSSLSTHGMVFTEWIGSRLPGVSVLGRIRLWGDGEEEEEGMHTLPLYLNLAGASAKPKFKLVEGIGPGALEMDKSRSNTLFVKSSLAGCGVDFDSEIYSVEEGMHDYLRPIIERVMGLLNDGLVQVDDQEGHDAGVAYWDWAAHLLWAYFPIFANWDDLAPLVEDMINPYEFLSQWAPPPSAPGDGESSGSIDL